MIEDLKKKAAQSALDCIKTARVIGLGSGSTVNFFIEALAKSSIKCQIEGVVAASTKTEKCLKHHGISVVDLNITGPLAVYIDGADEINKQLRLIKGGGGALTREKIIASASKCFICIADESKYVELLGKGALPIEVVPMARSYVAREIVKLGGFPVYRENFVTDNGNVILDTQGWDFTDPIRLERLLNNIPGVVCNGLFAQRSADKLMLGTTDAGVKVMEK